MCWSGIFNIGYEFNLNYKIEMINIVLYDMCDCVCNCNFYDVNEIEEGVCDFCCVDVVYEECEMFFS